MLTTLLSLLTFIAYVVIGIFAGIGLIITTVKLAEYFVQRFVQNKMAKMTPLEKTNYVIGLLHKAIPRFQRLAHFLAIFGESRSLTYVLNLLAHYRQVLVQFEYQKQVQEAAEKYAEHFDKFFARMLVKVETKDNGDGTFDHLWKLPSSKIIQ